MYTCQCNYQEGGEHCYLWVNRDRIKEEEGCRGRLLGGITHQPQTERNFKELKYLFIITNYIITLGNNDPNLQFCQLRS